MGVLTSGKGKVQRITVDWANINADAVEAGTPFGADGKIHDDINALGILMRQITKPWDGTAEILTAGFCDKAEMESLSGLPLSNEVQSALHDIKFGTDGVVNCMVAVAG